MIHIFDIKSFKDGRRGAALEAFCHSVRVLDSLRESYHAADYAIQFVNSAVRKAGLDVMIDGSSPPGEGQVVRSVSQLLEADRAARVKESESTLRRNAVEQPEFDNTG
jgi:hypothetical protein